MQCDVLNKFVDIILHLFVEDKKSNNERPPWEIWERYIVLRGNLFVFLWIKSTGQKANTHCIGQEVASYALLGGR